MTTSTARVLSDRPARYGKQLASHFSRKIDSHWDPETETGRCAFNLDHVQGVADLSVSEGEALVLRLEADEANIEKLENIVARHLVGFGKKDGLEVRFVRDGGEAGTVFTVADLPQR